MKPRASVELFLQQMKEIVREKNFILVDRKESMQYLADFQMSIPRLREVILALEAKDCFDGPEPDRDPRFARKWTVAEFDPLNFGQRLYLKLSISITDKQCKCLSVKLYKERVIGND